MTIEYKLSEEDFLVHQLYQASQSERIRKKREKNKMLMPLIYGGLCVLAVSQGQVVIAVFFLAVAILRFVLYPFWEQRQYLKHYWSVVRERYSDSFDRTLTLDLGDTYMCAKDAGSESRIQLTELIEIVEIRVAIFLKFKGEQALILPKDQIKELQTLIVELKNLAARANIEYTDDPEWKWQ